MATLFKLITLKFQEIPSSISTSHHLIPMKQSGSWIHTPIWGWCYDASVICRSYDCDMNQLMISHGKFCPHSCFLVRDQTDKFAFFYTVLGKSPPGHWILHDAYLKLTTIIHLLHAKIFCVILLNGTPNMDWPCLHGTRFLRTFHHLHLILIIWSARPVWDVSGLDSWESRLWYWNLGQECPLVINEDTHTQKISQHYISNLQCVIKWTLIKLKLHLFKNKKIHPCHKILLKYLILSSEYICSDIISALRMEMEINYGPDSECSGENGADEM